MQQYTFEIECRSGQVKTFTCWAESFAAARELLEKFYEEN